MLCDVNNIFFLTNRVLRSKYGLVQQTMRKQIFIKW